MKAFLEFCEKYPVRKFRKGDSILEQGDVPMCAYVVRDGFVKTFEITMHGDEKPLLFDYKYETFPIGWVFGHINTSPYFYDAYTDCELWCIPREDFVHFLKSNANSQFVVFDFFVQRYVMTLQLKVLAMAQTKARDKLLYLLKFFTARFCSDEKAKNVRLEIPFTQQDIANLVGLTRETTGIELKKLEREKAISYDHQIYTVNRTRLEELISEI